MADLTCDDGKTEVAGHTPGEELTPFQQAAVAAGHTLRRHDEEDGGGIDNFAFEAGFHNGPGCSVCHWSACEHCDRPIPACDGGAARREREATERVRDAAPELLEAAQQAVAIAESWIHDQLDGTSSLDDALAELTTAKAAIAKALGTEGAGR